MYKISVLLGVILFLSINLCFAQGSDDITLTTYYPSPYGVYGILRLYPPTSVPGSCQTGDLFYDIGDGGATRPSGVYECDNSNNWMPLRLWTRVNTYDMYSRSGRYVGIGTMNPQAPLHLFNPLDGTPKYSTVQDTYILYDVTDTQWYTGIDDSDNDKFMIGTGNAEGSNTAVTITTGGDVGIGTATPGKELDVAGDIHATGDICTDQDGGICLSNPLTGLCTLKTDTVSAADTVVGTQCTTGIVTGGGCHSGNSDFPAYISEPNGIGGWTCSTSVAVDTLTTTYICCE